MKNANDKFPPFLRQIEAAELWQATHRKFLDKPPAFPDFPQASIAKLYFDATLDLLERKGYKVVRGDDTDVA